MITLQIIRSCYTFGGVTFINDEVDNLCLRSVGSWSENVIDSVEQRIINEIGRLVKVMVFEKQTPKIVFDYQIKMIRFEKFVKSIDSITSHKLYGIVAYGEL